MEENKIEHSFTENPEDVPVKIVNFSRWVYFLLLLISLLTQLQYGITLLLALLLPSLIWGRKWNFIGRVGKLILRKRGSDIQYESRRLIYFNNIILVTLLFLAQGAFISGFNKTAWGFVVLVIIANGLALSGYCVGCVLYYRFKLYKYKILGDNY